MSNHQGLKSRNLITLPLDNPDVEILSVSVNEQGDYIVTVESIQNSAVCQSCGARSTKLRGYGGEIELRHLPILGHRLYIRLHPKRDECPNCNGKTTTQKLDWYEEKSPHTKAHDRPLMLQLVNSTVEDVSRKEEFGYDAVEGALERRLQVGVDWNQLTELESIGIDKIAMRKGRRDFVAILATQQSDGGAALLGILVDRQKDTIRQFYERIPKHLWPIRKNKADPTVEEQEKLDCIFSYSPDLKLAYDFREELTSIFESSQMKAEARTSILEWQNKVSQSVLTCFDKFLTTLNNWLDKIVNYFDGRFSSGFVGGGLNNKLKMAKRRCSGILKTTTLFQRLYLDMEGYRRFA